MGGMDGQYAMGAIDEVDGIILYIYNIVILVYNILYMYIYIYIQCI